MIFCFSKKLNKKYAIDFNCLYQVRGFKDGITVLELECDLSYYKGDHNPQFKLGLIFLNFYIFELNIYNIFHVNEEESDDK